RPRPAPAARAAPRLAGLGLELALAVEVLQGVEVRVDLQHHIAAAPAIAAIGPAARDVLLLTKVHGAVPALAGPHRDGGLIKVHVRDYSREATRILKLRWAAAPKPARP